MSKKKLIKELILKTNGKKVLFKDYDVVFEHNNEEYYVKILNVNSSTLVTVNSPKIWELKRGKVDGLRFRESSKTLIDLTQFSTHKNKIILLTMKPYKILKALNESDLKDISFETYVHEIHYLYEIDSIFKVIK